MIISYQKPFVTDFYISIANEKLSIPYKESNFLNSIHISKFILKTWLTIYSYVLLVNSFKNDGVLFSIYIVVPGG